MNKYIGTKLVEAEKATLAEAQALKTGACDTIEEARRRFGGSDDGNLGYVVKYPDGYISWSPKDVFEQSYMQVQEDPKLISGVLIGEHMVNDFISYTKTSTVGYKTVMVRCVLRNGIEIIETSTCVDDLVSFRISASDSVARN